VLSAVESVLQAMPGIPRGSIEAEVVDGALVLRGDVAGAEREREIVQAAGRVQGVASVESRLRAPGAAAAGA
jgi:osmotically-inducible protein OsmY